MLKSVKQFGGETGALDGGTHQGPGGQQQLQQDGRRETSPQNGADPRKSHGPS